MYRAAGKGVVLVLVAPVYWVDWELTASLCCQMVFEELA